MNGGSWDFASREWSTIQKNYGAYVAKYILKDSGYARAVLQGRVALTPGGYCEYLKTDNDSAAQCVKAAQDVLTKEEMVSK